MNPTFGAIIQARQNSSRLPGKMVKNLLGRPLILRVTEQVSYSDMLDNIVVATSDGTNDDQLSDLCLKNGVKLFRGDLDNVLERFIHAAEKFEIDVIIRITGDNPLTDPLMIDQLIERYNRKPDLDYINNVHREGAVHGAGCELVTLDALRRSYKIIRSLKNPEDYTEHVTLHIRKNTDTFNTEKFYPEEGLSRKEISYSIDYPEDFKLVEKIYDNLYSDTRPFNTREVLNFLDQNEALLELNSDLHGPLPEY